MTPLLKITDLTVTYGPVRALKGVSLDIRKGEIVSVLGANGAGKSTLLGSISRLLAIKDGTIEYSGEILNGLLPNETIARGIAHVPEGRRVFATLTVEENLNLGAYLRRGDKKYIREERDRMYHLFPRLAQRRKQLSGTLSGGEQQMLAMARGLMSSPRLLLLDEPSLGLAPLIVEQIFQIIREISASDISILLVEQNARKALGVAHRAYVLETGTVTLHGPAEEMRSNRKVQEAYLGGAALVGNQAS